MFEGREEGCVARQAVEARRSSGDVELSVDGTKVAVAVLSLATSCRLAKPSNLASPQRLRTALTASLTSPSFSSPQNISSLDVLEIPQLGCFLQAYTLTVAIIGITVKPRFRARYLSCVKSTGLSNHVQPMEVCFIL